METNVFKSFIEAVLKKTQENEYETEPGLRSSSAQKGSQTSKYFSHSEPNTSRGV